MFTTLSFESNFAINVIDLLVADHFFHTVGPISSFLTLLVAFTIYVITLKFAALHALCDLEWNVFAGRANIEINVDTLSFQVLHVAEIASFNYCSSVSNGLQDPIDQILVHFHATTAYKNN